MVNKGRSSTDDAVMREVKRLKILVRFDWHETHCWVRGGFAIPSESAASFLDALTNGFTK